MKIYLIVKSLLDYIFAFIFLIILSPIMICAAIAIMLDSKGTVLFKQRRPGRYGRIFEIYKFRTMVMDTNEGGIPTSDRERITCVGSILRKFSIDELPQLINIIKGEMSFIGPRPLLEKYLDYYTPEQMKRHNVKPGISGLAQVSGRNAISWEDKFKYDILYVDNVSFLLDVKIIFLTIIKVLRMENINQPGHATVEYYSVEENNKSYKI